MKNYIARTCMFALVLAMAYGMTCPAVNGELVFEDTFSTVSTPADEGRVWDSRLDVGWRATTGWVGSPPDSLWDITADAGGRLQNPSTNTTNYTEGETPVWNWFSNPASTNPSLGVRVMFDYGVASGDTLHMHLWAVQSGGAPGSNGFITNNQGWLNGNSGQNQVTSAAGYTPYNLLDGSNAPSTSSLTGALTGDGMVDITLDINALGIPGVTNVGDVDTFFVAFSMNEAGGGTTWIDNLNITTAIPEPTSLCMFALAMAGLTIRRRD
ncbi:MAG: PEP-CTERM sorting domain-containing protein [Planctomycetota bacterium]